MSSLLAVLVISQSLAMENSREKHNLGISLHVFQTLKNKCSNEKKNKNPSFIKSEKYLLTRMMCNNNLQLSKKKTKPFLQGFHKIYIIIFGVWEG